MWDALMDVNVVDTNGTIFYLWVDHVCCKE